MRAYEKVGGVCAALLLASASSMVSAHSGHGDDWTFGAVEAGDGMAIKSGSGSMLRSAEGIALIKKAVQAIHDAEAAIKAAKKVGFEWRDSGKILKQADKAAAEGNIDKAMAQAERARFQGEAGQAQAASQANAGPRFDEIVARIQGAEQAIAEADAARKAAAKVGFEWRDTGKMINKARRAADASHYGKATRLARKAKFQGEAGQLQAVEQANAGPRFQ